MKKFLLKILLFVAVLALIDILSGYCFPVLRSWAKSGQTYKIEYISNVCTDDIIILGSSRADHHYVPSVFEEDLNHTCYNAGEMGCGIIPAYARYKMISKRHKPKLVIYEVTPGYDYLEDNDYSAYVGTLRQYLNDKDIKEVYLDFSDKLERIRIVSNLYRNNSKLVKNLKDAILSTPSYKGYEPLYGTLPSNYSSKRSKTGYELLGVDTLKYNYLTRLVEDTKKDGVPLVFAISPIYGNGQLPSEYHYIIDLCEEHNIPIINNSYCSGISEASYFQDSEHLNHEGATLYSHYVANQVKAFIK